MSEDIFKDWKVNKFIVAEPDLHDFDDHLVILTDVRYWTDHIDELLKWCSKHGCTQEGMAIRVPSDSKLTHFILAWS